METASSHLDIGNSTPRLLTSRSAAAQDRRRAPALAGAGGTVGVPEDIAVIDTMIGLPMVDRLEWQQTMASVLRDQGSRGFTHPAGYMYKHTPEVPRDADSIGRLLFEMDRFGIERGLVPVDLTDDLHVRTLRDHSDRLLGSLEVDPNRGV